jgi:hypothetical protein
MFFLFVEGASPTECGIVSLPSSSFLLCETRIAIEIPDRDDLKKHNVRIVAGFLFPVLQYSHYVWPMSLVTQYSRLVAVLRRKILKAFLKISFLQFANKQTKGPGHLRRRPSYRIFVLGFRITLHLSPLLRILLPLVRREPVRSVALLPYDYSIHVSLLSIDIQHNG